MSNIERSDISLFDGSGEALAREALRLVFYLTTPHQNIAQAVRQAIVAFVDLVSIDALAFCYNLDGDAIALSQSTFAELMHDWFEGAYSEWPNATIELNGHGTLASAYGLRYWGQALGIPEYPDEVSFLEVWMPRNFFLDRRPDVNRFMHDVIANVPACSAYANLALVSDEHQLKQGLAARYLGLDIADPSTISSDLGMKCPGAYWINYLCASLTHPLGGVQAMRVALGPEIRVDEFAGGVLVQLSEAPELGDRNRGETLVNYQAFARFVAAKGLLHVRPGSTYFRDEQGFVDADAQEAWHRRFLDQVA